MAPRRGSTAEAAARLLCPHHNLAQLLLSIYGLVHLRAKLPGPLPKVIFFLFINQFNASLIILMECERKHLCPMTSTVSLGRKSSILVYLKKIRTRSNKLKGANRTLISFIPENSDLLLSAQLLPWICAATGMLSRQFTTQSSGFLLQLDARSTHCAPVPGDLKPVQKGKGKHLENFIRNISFVTEMEFSLYPLVGCS